MANAVLDEGTSLDTAGYQKEETTVDTDGFSRKHIALIVPNFDTDPIEPARKMTSYLWLGAMPKEWKQLPGADLQLAVHGTPMIGSGNHVGADGATTSVDTLGQPTTTATGKTDKRWPLPSMENLVEIAVEAVDKAIEESKDDALAETWATLENATAAAAAAETASTEESAESPEGTPAETETEEEGVTAEDFAKFFKVTDPDEEAFERAFVVSNLSTSASASPLAHGAASVMSEPVIELMVGAITRVSPDPVPVTATVAFVNAFNSLKNRAKAALRTALTTALADVPDEVISSKWAKYPAFVDDYRHRGVNVVGKEEPGEGERAEGHTLSAETRNLHSIHLHTRGGWRDHSDGNRITTTYGDKIEVVRGNYKLVVLGRQDDPKKSSGVDASGQFIEPFNIESECEIRREWHEFDEEQGMWNSQKRAENAIETTSVSGSSYEFWWGLEKQETVGSADPVTPTGDNPCARRDGVCRANPNIVEKTWARSIKEYKGSATCPVPTIDETTWAGSITETKHADSISETTTVTGKIYEETNAAVKEEISHLGVLADFKSCGQITEMTVAAQMSEVTVSANKLEVFLGTKVDIAIAAILEVLVGAKTEIVLNRTGLHVNEIETKLEHLETVLEKTKVRLEDTELSLSCMETSLEIVTMALEHQLM